MISLDDLRLDRVIESPFKHIPREEATVGALHARAADVDISETSKEEYRRRYELADSGA